ncbi:hypothetical protein, conserved [Plasmodium gonderi]|uniref:MORN repeat protein n=1 Tax=Plasmodium gonderi TaxID=77519 RepID=A0A1Y1JT24_PLAGO|nr:hypothetical protein, conserved [Plasmodium gonderi]GAW83094.1 hypothetical protein, conserved [Plasmodium gonderi]
MRENSGREMNPINFVVNEKEEFLNIFNYKSVKCFKSCNYIYIGQVKKSSDAHESKEKDIDSVGNKNEDIKKIETKEFTSNRAKTDKKNKKKSNKYIKDGYGILITLQKNAFGEDIVVNKFIGNWKNNKKSGLGFNLYINKNIYFGYYENNAKNGWGYYEWSFNQSSYEGTWVNNYMNGKGTYKNKIFTFEGDFYNNKFLNQYGEWIDVIQLEKKNKKMNLLKTDIISSEKMIYLIVLPFNFLKDHLKKFADIIKNKFNKVPFIMCSKSFIEKYRNFNLSKFIFLSYYFSLHELFGDIKSDQLIFDNIKKNCEKESRGEKTNVGYKGPNCAFSKNSTRLDSEELEEFQDRESDSSSNEFSYSSSSEGYCKSPSSNTSISSKFSNGAINSSDESFSNCSKSSYTTQTSVSSTLPLRSSMSIITNSFDNFKSTKDDDGDLHNSNTHSLNKVNITKNESKGSSESDLKEYIKNANKSNDFKEENVTEALSKVGSSNDSSEKFNSDICNEDTFYKLEERRKNEIHKLVNKYVNIYVDSENESCEYSIISSETESSAERESFPKMKNEGYFFEKAKGGDLNENEERKTKNMQEKKQTGGKSNQQMNMSCSEVNVPNDVDPPKHNDLIDAQKKIEKELSKIKIDIQFLEKLRNCNLPCTPEIKKKIVKSMILKYPFIFNLNISEDENKYENISNEFLLRNFVVPELWSLKNYFGTSENKLPEEVFTPPYLDFKNSKISMHMHHQIGKNNNLDLNVNSINDEKNFNLNFFFITDLLVDDTKDINDLKCLIRNKFTNSLYLNNLFFVILE